MPHFCRAFCLLYIIIVIIIGVYIISLNASTKQSMIKSVISFSNYILSKKKFLKIII